MMNLLEVGTVYQNVLSQSQACFYQIDLFVPLTSRYHLTKPISASNITQQTAY